MCRCVMKLRQSLLLCYLLPLAVMEGAEAMRQQAAIAPNAQYAVKVDGKTTLRSLTHFWESTGLCPPLPHSNFSAYFLSDDELQNLAHIGATPNGGLKQVRIHWLLELITASGETYNFTLLDKALDILLENGLKPGFEIMGNPSALFTDFENKTQVYAWRDLVAAIAQHYIDRYGLDYVSSWNFETWNEPDNHDFDSLNFTVQGYLNYYDACLVGLKSVEPSLQLGTPGEACRGSHSAICKALLDHCYNGSNYFTGEEGVEVDYLSFHLKGKGYSTTITDLIIDTYDMISSDYSRFKNKPIFNDEADPLSGWSKPEPWRAEARYAAMVAKVIALHQNYVFPKYSSFNFQLLSNDNGFMNFGPPSFFDQRTLTARFQMNLTKPRSVEFVRKPVLSVMGLLSLLGSQQIQADVSIGDLPVPYDDDVGIIATILPAALSPSKSAEAAFLIYRSNDTSDRFDNSSSCTLKWEGLPDLGADAMLVHYQLDNSLKRNPYHLWLMNNSPNYPRYDLLRAMRDASDNVREKGPLPFSLEGSYAFLLPLPGVVLLHACQKPASPPSKVMGIRLHEVIDGESMIIWSDVPERCILTYEVGMSLEVNGTYTRINSMDTIFSVYVDRYSNYKHGMKLYYKARAVDYWHQAGAYSDTVCRGC